MDTFADEFRAGLIRKIGVRISAKQDALLKAEQEVAKLRTEYEQLQKTETRLNSEECPPLVCPSCFYERHTSSPLRAIPFRTENVDLFECKTCEHQWQQPE